METKDRDTELAQITNWLTDRFRRWEHLSEHGGSDPFHSDGANLNLIRNHIIAGKLAIERLLQDEPAELSFFDTPYPEIYYRETPDEVPDNYMVKEAEIRQRANEQYALYLQDPNFLYCLKNHSKVFSKGETRATKAAGLSIWNTAGLRGYKMYIEEGNPVDLRRVFYEPYESKAIRWAEYAKSLKAFLEAEHRPEDNVVVPDEYSEDEYLDDGYAAEEVEPKPAKKRTLDAQISSASAKAESANKTIAPRQEQLSLF